MRQGMIERSAVIRNEQGIHCRPSAVIVKALMQFAGDVTAVTEEGEADCRSIMGLLSLGLQKDCRVLIRVSGPDEERLCEQLVQLFETEFDFPPRSS